MWGLLRAVPVPMIAAMQGNAVGFGFELALQCDVRLASDDAVLALPEARIGMIPAGGASETLPRLAGTSAGLYAVLSGERFSARDALARIRRRGRPRAELRARADSHAATLAARPTAAVRAAKAAIWAALDLPLAVGLGERPISPPLAPASLRAERLSPPDELRKERDARRAERARRTEHDRRWCSWR